MEKVFERAKKEAEILSSSLPPRVSIGDLERLAGVLEVDVLWDNIHPLDSVVAKVSSEDAHVVMSSRLSSEDARFCLAHVLGHVVERERVSGFDEYVFEDSMFTERNVGEFFADEFAFEILLPSEDLTSLIQDGELLDNISQMRGVPVDMIVDRWDALRRRSE